jgi:hypothetical protein
VTSLERAAAWIVTGPVGVFAAGAADWCVLLWRYWSARLLGRSDS